MSSRRTLNQTETKSSNPASKFLEWKSTKKCFSYYDKDKKINVDVQLPIKFQFLEDFHTVKGFSDSEQTGIYSNEVKFTSTEELHVKTFSGIDIASGLYNDIKLKILQAGGKYHKSIYAILNGEIVNIQVKGSVVSAWSLFANGQKKTAKQPLIKGHSNKFEGNWIEVNKFEDLKKGATEYTVPVFEIGEQYTTAENTEADNKYKVVADYFENYTKEEEPEVNTPEDNEDIPF